MKKVFYIIPIFFISLFFATCVSAEEIADYKVTIDVGVDGVLKVKEEILYAFGEENRHGIYREIPYKYKARGGNFSLRFSGFKVTDDMNREKPSVVTKESGKHIIKIGDPDRFVSGIQKYNISYQVERAINYLSTGDELYWNVTGNDWEVLIKQAQITINFPESLPDKALDTVCFSGIYGSDQPCVSSRYIFSNSADADGVSFVSDKLNPGEGFTIAVSMPQGTIDKPGILASVWYVVRDNWILFLPFLVLYLMYRLWLKKGKDPIGRQTIIAEFTQPDDLSPAMVGVMVDERVDNKDISAELIHLAVLGFIKIERFIKSGLLKSHDYRLTLLKPSGTLPYKYQRDLVDKIFDGKKEVNMSDLKNTFYKDLNLIKKEIYAQVVQSEYFPDNPNKVRGIYLVIGVLIVIISWFMGPIFDWYGVLSFVASGVVVLVFSFIMPKKTKKGVRALEHIKGFKQYLNVAEKDRIDFHNAPAKEPKLFEKFLPFAMVLGVEKAWAQQFADIYNENPSWYADAGTKAFVASDLTNSLNTFSAKASTNLASTPSSASSGGSGFSGGGSGGGFGGGGGGSW